MSQQTDTTTVTGTAEKTRESSMIQRRPSSLSTDASPIFAACLLTVGRLRSTSIDFHRAVRETFSREPPTFSEKQPTLSTTPPGLLST